MSSLRGKNANEVRHDVICVKTSPVKSKTCRSLPQIDVYVGFTSIISPTGKRTVVAMRHARAISAANRKEGGSGQASNVPTTSKTFCHPFVQREIELLNCINCLHMTYLRVAAR